ncbi:MAG: peptide chain release factor 2 [Bacilli bacterium]|nr:peptide chain release factor 2 [Bacilli bacterium]
MTYGGYFEPEKKLKRKQELEKIMLEPNFWNEKKKSETIINELNNIKNNLDRCTKIKNKIYSNIELIECDDEEIINLLTEDIKTIEKELNELESLMVLNGPYDEGNAIIEIHPGAGGTESCDWAEMLYRMYKRWCEKKKFKIEVIDYQDGEVAGIKSVSMLVKGIYAYGYLKCEKGVHRLIRISPFDSGDRRHTSFASVDVMPLFDNNVDIKINPNDIRIDIFRSSGCGGQGVNTTDSAVRILHIPTKIMVTCQDERSQIQNKEKAMEVLKSRLYQLELEKRDEELKKIQGLQKEINFGSQIRSYVMHPYSMVKDHRTNTETSNVEKVLDGDIDIFINDVLKGGYYE